MTLVRSGGLIIVAVLGAVGPQDSAKDQRQVLLDAAERYQEIYRTWPEEAAYLFGNPEMVDPALAARCIAELRPILNDVRAALQAGSAGWESDPFGSNMTAPSLEQGALRAIHIAMHTDIGYRLHTGDTSVVARELSNLLRLDSLTQNEGGVMASVHALATVNSTVSLIQERALASGALTPEQCAEIGAALDASVGDDPFGFSAAMQAERDEIVNMLSAEESDAFDDLVEARLLAGDDESIVALSELPDDALDAATAGYEAAMTEFIALCGDFSDPSAKPRIQKLLDEIEAGGFGPVAAAFMPRFNVAGLVHDNIQVIRETQATLEAIASGAMPASQAANAAFFYRMAIEKLDEIPPDGWREIELFCTIDRPAAAPASFESEPAWKELLNLIDKASAIERCEFMARHERIRNGLWPHVHHLDGMQSCAMALTAALNLARRRENDEECLKRAADLLILIDHITQEALVEHSDRAMALLDFVEPSLTAALETLDGDSRGEIEEALARYEEDDPFAYAASRATYAALVKQTLRPRADAEAWFRQAQWAIDRCPDSWLSAADLDRAALHAELKSCSAENAGRAAAELIAVVEPTSNDVPVVSNEPVLPLLMGLLRQPLIRMDEGAAASAEALTRLRDAAQ
jgi:hypothetical protein